MGELAVRRVPHALPVAVCGLRPIVTATSRPPTAEVLR